jgi:hypothetical protein
MFRRFFLICLFLICLILASVAVLVAQPPMQVPSARLCVVLRDQTSSFRRLLPACDLAIGRILDATGPGDTVLVIEIAGGRFDAGRQVHEMALPGVRAEVFQSKNNIDFNGHSAELKKAWDAAGPIREEFRRELEKPVSLNVGDTNLYAALEYAWSRARGFQGAVVLVTASDLVYEMGSVKSGLPPLSAAWAKQKGALAGAAAVAMFVPFQAGGASDRKLEAWRSFFASAGARFAAYDESQSRSVAPFPPSPVPRKLIHPMRIGAGK